MSSEESARGAGAREVLSRVHLPPLRWIVLGALGLVAVVWLVGAIADAVADIDLEAVDHPYALVAAFVVFDAIIPVFPSESLLNTGSILAIRDDSSIEIWKLVVAGTVGAAIGDTLLYWISRTVLRGFMQERLDQALENDKVAEAFDVLRGQAPILIVFGRFVPGVRFVVGTTMGLTRFPYPRFLLWDLIGSAAWASFACVSSALISVALGGQPLVSIVASALITTALLAFLYKRLRRALEAREATTAR